MHVSFFKDYIINGSKLQLVCPQSLVNYAALRAKLYWFETLCCEVKSKWLLRRR